MIIIIIIITIIIIIISQISRSIIDFVTLLLTVPQNDNFSSKVYEVNNRLKNICGGRDIIFIDCTVTIDIERRLYESKIHLNKPGTREFATNVFIKAGLIIVVMHP